MISAVKETPTALLLADNTRDSGDGKDLRKYMVLGITSSGRRQRDSVSDRGTHFSEKPDSTTSISNTSHRGRSLLELPNTIQPLQSSTVKKYQSPTSHPANTSTTMADKAKQVEFLPSNTNTLRSRHSSAHQRLQGYLDPNNPDYYPERQHVNIQAAIKHYEDGKIDEIQMNTIMDDKISTLEDAFASECWIEVLYSPHELEQLLMSAKRTDFQ